MAIIKRFRRIFHLKKKFQYCYGFEATVKINIFDITYFPFKFNAMEINWLLHLQYVSEQQTENKNFKRIIASTTVTVPTYVVSI